MLPKGTFATPRGIASWFVNHVDRSAGEVITHLKLQKLVYYTEAWYLANFDRPLTNCDYEAWTHGPVCRNLYSQYSDAGFDPLPAEQQKDVPEPLTGFLSAIRKKYGQFSAKRLEEMTHQELPWLEARGTLPLEARCETPISKLTMRNFYAGKIGKQPIARL